MEDLKRAINNCLSASSAESDGLEKNKGLLKALTDGIQQLLKKEQAILNDRIAEEEKHVHQLNTRYKSLRSGESEDAITEHLQGDLMSKMKYTFGVKRSGAIDEILNFSDKAEEDVACLTQEQSYFLQFIVEDSFKFCKEKAMQQQTQLENALKISNETSDENKKVINDEKLAAEMHNLQVHLDNEVIPFLFKEYLSHWEERIKNTAFKIKQPAERIRNFIYSCIDLCWFMTIHTKDYRFVWDITSHANHCVNHAASKQRDNQCDIRVFKPALKDGKDKIIIEGRSMCISCEHINVEDSIPLSDIKTQSQRDDIRDISQINVVADVHTSEGMKSSSEAKPIKPQENLSTGISNTSCVPVETNKVNPGKNGQRTSSKANHSETKLKETAEKNMDF